MVFKFRRHGNLATEHAHKPGCWCVNIKMEVEWTFFQLLKKSSLHNKEQWLRDSVPVSIAYSSTQLRGKYQSVTKTSNWSTQVCIDSNSIHIFHFIFHRSVRCSLLCTRQRIQYQSCNKEATCTI